MILLAGCDNEQHVILSINNVGGETPVMLGMMLGNGARYLVGD